MTTTLVLGGTSWVGGLIAQEALARGHEVTCLARGQSGAAPDGVELVVADRSAAGAYERVAGREWDLVIDVARQPGHVRSAVAALGSRVGHWTLVSTGSVYADQSGVLTEDSPLLRPADVDEVEPQQYGEGKVACEEVVNQLPRHLVVRVGLIGGPGDRSDRLGYYVSRFALAAGGPVLVPDVANQPMQVLDARDLASWVVLAAQDGTTGVVHSVGEPTTVGALIDLSAQVAGGGDQVAVDPEWLRRHDVEEWMGPRSLPLWLPASHVGMGMMADARALAVGLRRRTYEQMLRDTLADERERGIDRGRSAGLSRADELEVIEQLRRDQRGGRSSPRPVPR